MLTDQSGAVKGELKRGEHKILQTNRVIQMPGPDDEVATVNQIYRWLVEDDLPMAEIVKRLNGQPIHTDLDHPWTYSTARQVLTNEKYIGYNVYNRHSPKLKKTHVDSPPEMWIRKEGTFTASFRRPTLWLPRKSWPSSARSCRIPNCSTTSRPRTANAGACRASLSTRPRHCPVRPLHPALW